LKTLLLVDIQNDFLSGGALAVPRGDEIIEVVNRLMLRFDLVLASQDWHPPDHGSFAINHPGKKPGQVIELNGLKQVLWPPHCLQGSYGAQLADTLYLKGIYRIFRKGMDRDVDSYSAFFDNGHRRDTGLADYLREKRSGPLYIAGLATDYCVKFTALDARMQGFDTYLIEDGCRGVELEPGDVDRALEEMKNAGVILVRSDSISGI
jgi:nicotinamidase/pyrazinamidase